MFAKFKISIENVREINKQIVSLPRFVQNNTDSTLISDEIKLLLEDQDGIIDGEKLKTEYFPTKLKKNYNVFISHSHGDIDEIEQFARKFEIRYGVKCFVDSMVWKNIATLQRKIDNAHKNPNGSLDYELVKQSTAHIHSLLSIALFEMIDQCECCIFVQSDNSLALDFNETMTLSPWIYEEIFYMNHARKILPERIPERKLFCALNENNRTDAQIKMSHVIDLSEFRDLISALPNSILQGDTFLNHIYWRSGLIEQISYLWG